MKKQASTHGRLYHGWPAFKLLVACSTLIAFFAACTNPLMKAVEAIRADAVSPRIVLSLADETVIASGGSLDCGSITSGSSFDVELTIANEGNSALEIGVDDIVLKMGTGTGEGDFAIITKPAVSIAALAASSMVLRFVPSTDGTKTAVVSIPTNDTQNQLFSFTIEGTRSPIALTTSAISNITTTTATGGGNITDAGGLSITARGICWSTLPNPTTDDGMVVDAGTGTGGFTDLIVNLSAGTLYYVRTYATTNEAGTSYGPQVSFITLPDAPAMPTVSPIGYSTGSGKLTIDWSTVTGASIYDLFYSSSTSFPSSQTPISTTDTTYTIAGLSDFSTYYFWLKARNASGSSSASPSNSGAPGVHVTGVDLDQATLSLSIGSTRQINASVAPADATYPAVTWSSSDTAIATVSSGLVTSIGPGTATITATSTATAIGNISTSATCAVNIPPAAPTVNTAASAEGGQVVLSWSSVTGATSYNIYYSKSSGAGTAGTKVSGVTATSYTIGDLTNWSTYYFVVTAVGAGGESTASNQRSCMPIRQEIIVVNNTANSIDFNLFNASSGSVIRPSGHEYIFGPNGFAATDYPSSVAIDPNARNAMYIAYTGTAACFATYSYSASGGYATSPYTDHHCDGAGSEHLTVVTTPSGKKCIYVAYNAQAFLAMYDIDASGNLSTRHYYDNSRTDSARYLSADPSGRFLFASNYDASRITSYAIDSATGHLTESGYVASGGSKPYRSVVTPDGGYLLVVNYGSGNVVSFAINSSTGVLTQQSSISTLGEGPTGIAIDAEGGNVYVCSAKNRANPNLLLGMLNHFTFSGGNLAGASDWAQTLYGPLDIALDATGSRAIVLNASVGSYSYGNALVYPVDVATGAVSSISSASSFVTGGNPIDLIVVKLP
jgi:hypothetical protein